MGDRRPDRVMSHHREALVTALGAQKGAICGNFGHFFFVIRNVSEFHVMALATIFPVTRLL
jgi:hypothetical protein